MIEFALAAVYFGIAILLYSASVYIAHRIVVEVLHEHAKREDHAD